MHPLSYATANVPIENLLALENGCLKNTYRGHLQETFL